MPIPEIRLRPYRISDAPLMLEAALESIPEIAPWMPWCSPGYDLIQAQSWVNTAVQHWRERTAFEFVIEDAHTHRVLGASGVNQLNAEHPMANLSYWVRTSATRQGVASRAARLAADWAFANTTLERLDIVIAVGNLPSQKTAQKLGAVREGILRARLLLHGVMHDAVQYSLIRSDS